MEPWEDLNLKVGSRPKPALAKLRNILYTPKFCTICYDTGVQLQNLDVVPVAEGLEDAQLNLREILEEIFQDSGSKIILSNYVCSICQVKMVYAYSFIHTTRKSSEVFEHYLTQLHSESIDLLNCMQDNISCANAVIVLEELGSKEKPNIEKFRWNSHQAPAKEKHISDVQLSRNTITKNYMCDYCKKEFCDKKFLIAHLNTCGLCKTIANTSQQGPISHPDIPCPKCPKRPCTHEKFIKHFADQKDKFPKTRCLECSYTSSSLRLLIDHVERKHMDELADNCELCGKIFYMREQYFSHFETFHQEYKVCSYCSAVFRENDFSCHEMECMIAEKPYSCTKCPARFESELLSSVHELKHEDGASTKKRNKRIVLKRSYACPLCSERFTGKLKLQRHCNDAHGVESYKNNHCQFCDIKFKTKKEYLLHIRQMQHMAKIDPNHSYKHKCQYCDYTARHSFILKTHMNRYHLKVMPFECGICNKKFLDKRKLKAHIDRHMGTGKRMCPTCGDTLGSTTALIKHTRLHTGERPYPCHLCDVSLNSASERKFHILRKHTEKTHPCPLCEAKFHIPYFVRRHIQQVHWKRKEKFDHTKLEGLGPEHYDLFRDRRMVVL